MFHPDDGEASFVSGGADHGDRLFQLGVVQSGHDLVEQQQPRSTNQSPSQLKEPLLVKVEAADHLIGVSTEANKVQRLVSQRLCGDLRRPFTTTKRCADDDVLADR